MQPSCKPSVGRSSNIKHHQSQVITASIIIMNKLEIFRELLKCDTETGSERTRLGKMAPIDPLDEVVP